MKIMSEQDTLEVKASEITGNISSAVTAYGEHHKCKPAEVAFISLKLLTFLHKGGYLVDIPKKGFRLKKHQEIELRTHDPTPNISEGENIGVTENTTHLLTLGRRGFCRKLKNLEHYDVEMDSSTFTQLVYC